MCLSSYCLHSLKGNVTRNLNSFQGELDDVEEEEVKSDSFLKHKFSEIEEEFDDINLVSRAKFSSPSVLNINSLITF